MKNAIRIAAFALVFASAVIAAQTTQPDSPPAGGSQMEHKGMMHDMNMPGMHTMPATVKSVDAKTGVVDVDSAGMSLRVHFPPETISSLKAGDKITLHLGFEKQK